MRYRGFPKVVALIAMGATALLATPSTQIWIPSTDIQGFLNPHLGWDAYLNAYGNGLISNGGITTGVLPFSKIGLEVGVDYRDIGGNHQYPVYFNAKIGVPEDSLFKYQPAIAIGIFDAGLKDKVTNYDVTYGLIAKNIWKLGRFSVGGYYGAGPDNLWTSSPKADGTMDTVKAGVLASWDRTISEISDKLWLAVDYQSGNNGYGALSFGLSWNWAPNVSTILGYDIWNDDGLSKPTFTFQVDINLK